MLLLLERLAERRIEEARREGAFDNLPGAGKPLDLDEPPLVPEEVRVAHRILRNAGVLPPEVEARREAVGLRTLLRSTEDREERRRAGVRLALLEAALEAEGRRLSASYRPQVLERLGGDA